MSAAALPLWADWLVGTLVLAGAALALLGAWGLARLPGFFERVHMPAIIATGACWCVALATAVFFSVRDGVPAVFPLLAVGFAAVTVPIATIFLMRASLFRARQLGQDVPPNVSRAAPAPEDAPPPDRS